MTGMPTPPSRVIELSQVTKVYGEGEGEVRALRGIDVKQHAPRAADTSDLANVRYDADLVVDVHDRDENRIGRDRGCDLPRCHVALRVAIEVRDGDAFTLERLRGRQYGFMLDARRD